MTNFKVELYKVTTDDFCSNINGNQVLVKYQGNISPPNTKPLYRVSVWGSDDFGMVYDTPFPVIAETTFQSIVFSDDVTIKFLENLGFNIF